VEGEDWEERLMPQDNRSAKERAEDSDGRGRVDKKPYQSPSLVEFGSIRELTRGAVAGTEDAGINGTGGV
jgi:hypothetical protein